MEKIYNLRDIGGHRTADGRFHFRTGLLYRSDDPAGATSSDLAQLQKLNLKLICDLRAPQEIRKPAPAGIRVVNIPLHDHATHGVSRLKGFGFLLSRDGGDRFLQFSHNYYRHIAFERAAQIREIFHLLAEEDSLPALIHCRAGKDRTGLIAALLQLLIGIPYETVLQDYLQTNEAIKPRLDRMIQVMRRWTLYQVPAERMRLLAAAKQEYLDGVYNRIQQQHGTAEAFLQYGCGIDPEALNRLKSKLLSAPRAQAALP